MTAVNICYVEINNIFPFIKVDLWEVSKTKKKKHFDTNKMTIIVVFVAAEIEVNLRNFTLAQISIVHNSDILQRSLSIELHFRCDKSNYKALHWLCQGISYFLTHSVKVRKSI